MKITVQSIHFTADKGLLEFIQKKVDKLDTFYDHIINGEVYLKLENVEDEANKITEIKVMIPGNQVILLPVGALDICIELPAHNIGEQGSE